MRVFILLITLLCSYSSVRAQCSCCEINKDDALAYIDSAEQWDMLNIPMRDGINLNARLIFPIGMEKRNLPTVLIRTPYHIPVSELRWFAEEVYLFLNNGYAVMVNTERGRYWSEGKYTFLAGAKHDGYDVVDWIGKQEWSNGAVGTFGCSSGAEHQLGLATQDHPAHKAMITLAAGAGIGEAGPYHDQGMFYRGGVLQMAFVAWYYLYGYSEIPRFGTGLSREDKLRLSKFYDVYPTFPKSNRKGVINTLPVMAIIDSLGGLKSDYSNFVRRLPNDERWHDVEFAGNSDSFGVPCLHLNSWYDASFGPTSMEIFRLMKEQAYDRESAENQFMIITAMGHCEHCKETEKTTYGDLNLGDARFDYYHLYIEWLDHWLKGEGKGFSDRKAYQVYTTGRNEWQHFDKWPPENAERVRYYLDHDAPSNTRDGGGQLSLALPSLKSDTFTYDPGDPVPSHGGNSWNYLNMRQGAVEQSMVETRGDVLVYTSEPLSKDLQLTGPVDVVIYLSSDVPDTDLAVKLVDVHPNDSAYYVDQSIQRIRWRNGYESPEFMKEGAVYKVKVGPLLTSHQFKKGHRLRLQVTSSNFPINERNLNTGGNNFDEVVWRIAHNRIHVGGESASYIEAWMVPGP